LRVKGRARSGAARSGAAALLFAASCASAVPVERAYDGRVVEGRYIEPAAYAAYLRGAIAESAGDSKRALVAFTEAARLDPDSVETAQRIAGARCEARPRECAPRRAEGDSSPASREHAIALALGSVDPAAAWGALVVWARRRDDVALEAFALARMAVADPSRRDEIAEAAEELAGLGQLTAARAVAALAFDAADAPFSDERRMLARRLAVDEAIVRGDADATRRRAIRARIGPDEAAARALLHDQPALAVDLAMESARADPGDLGSCLVLAAMGKGSAVAGCVDIFGASAAVRASKRRLPAAVWVVFGRAAMRALGPGGARTTLAGVDHDAVIAGDDAVSRTSVVLALRRAVDAHDLSPEGALELAVARDAPPAERAAFADTQAMDPRHRYLRLALADPGSKETVELGERLARVAPNDRVAAAATGIARLGSAMAAEPDAAAKLFARDAGDPLLVAVALRLANKLGDAVTLEKARTTLALLAHGLD
jgi:hypothetical protein